MLEAQYSTFEARRKNVESDVAALQESISALVERIDAGKIQLRNTERQLTLYSEEIDSKAQLASSGLIRKSELLTLQRGHAAQSGEIGRLMGEVGDARERIARTKEQINGVYHTAVKTAMEQLHETLGELQDVRERIRSQRAILDRVQIAAPVRRGGRQDALSHAGRRRRSGPEHHGSLAGRREPGDRGARAAPGHRPCRRWGRRPPSGSTS